MPLVELKIFLSDLVTVSPHHGRMKNAPTLACNLGGNRLIKQRQLDNPNIEGSKRLRRGECCV
jgi:hypothetical protein